MRAGLAFHNSTGSSIASLGMIAPGNGKEGYMKLSVALCTYNGEQYLPEQLGSIREQSRLPDEVVICDDASNDRSLLIVQEFAEQVPFPVRIVANAANLGSTPNFDKAIGLCGGDVIVLADQDDIWRPHKLETLESSLKTNLNSGFVFSDAEIVDQDRKPFGYTLWEAVGFASNEQDRFQSGEAFEALLKRYRVTGATMAFRSQYRNLIQPIPAPWLHDAWIALLISSIAPCALVREPLIQYRQHGRQQLGERKRGLFGEYRSARKMTREAFEAAALRYSMARDRLSQIPGFNTHRLALLDKKLAHYCQRIAMRCPGRWRLPTVLSEMWRGNYRRFSRGWKAIAQDLLMK
jgi:glycosyltransferase involved in cell wall biosynthesis